MARRARAAERLASDVFLLLTCSRSLTRSNGLVIHEASAPATAALPSNAHPRTRMSSFKATASHSGAMEGQLAVRAERA